MDIIWKAIKGYEGIYSVSNTGLVAMLQLKYINEPKTYSISFATLNQHIVQLKGDFPIKTSGFTLSREGIEEVLGDYSGYTTVYREIDGGVQFSNDGSIYVPPIPPTPPEPYIPTLDEVREQKVVEMNKIQQTIIQEGVDVQLSDGTVEHFALDNHDEISIIGQQLSILLFGDSELPWHVNDETIHCRFYSDEDMKIIGRTCNLFVTWHVTYFRDLRIYIQSLEIKEEVEAITYGIEIPEEFRSAPLKKMMEVQIV